MSNSKHILLFSGWQTCNIGDVGHTPGTLRFLEQYVPAAGVTVYLINANEAVLSMLQGRFRNVEFIVAESQEHCDENGLFTHPRLTSAFEECDLVIQNSGMHYNQFYGLKPWLLRACMRANKPFGIYGQSFDGFAEEGRDELVDWLSQSAFIFCRDRLSLNYLKECGVHAPVMDFGPDGCFGIDVMNRSQGQAYLSENHLEAGTFLSVTLRSNSPNLHAGAASVLNPKVISESDRLENERWSAALRQVIIDWVETTGKPVLLAPEVDKEIGNAHTMLLERLPDAIREHVVWRDSFWTVEEAAAVYSQAAALVSMEPHSCIIALANKVPAIHYYSRKHGVKATMFADIGLKPWLHDIDAVEPNVVSACLQQIIHDPALACAQVEGALAQVETAAARTGDTIRDVLDLPLNHAQETVLT
ncbi:polysaccharide pyruvyl transferase family protein [Coraliomargarita sp. SDUM461004]|uniref:Polysaccharide pyruvyl transferase family protein n=1 Tax=Thalassobacterium sedimentorum TaxID=3041258 RepID=A0ABU1AKJ3_9BACT|nr:polysaccharide pyruvyl transferase family protein [Coraliomargarita sp. SDUM461004]MDQ8195335.1 polysaccharide pyruvyl transferase family protein [Coraliomargarita sp. SDUM461004]